MKTLKFTLLIASLFSFTLASAQTDEATTKRLIEEQNFVFKATSAMPLSNADISAVLRSIPGNTNAGGTIQLTGAQYDLVINKDSIEAYLPYYGRSYTPEIGTNDNGIKFKSKDFAYKTSKGKKNGWTIKINPKDVRNNQNMTLMVTTNGYATLNVNNNNKQPITFNGYIAEAKEKKD